MRSLRIRLSTLVLLVSLILSTAAFGPMKCSHEEERANINRAINIVEGTPALVASFQLSAGITSSINKSISTAIDAAKAYRDDPTEQTWLRGLNTIDHLVSTGAFKTGSPKWDARLIGVITLFRTVYAALGPNTLAEISHDSEDGKAARRELERNIQELERLVKQRD